MSTANVVPCPRVPSKAILCLHGIGSSGVIFRLQLNKLRLTLEDDFEFVFMNAPNLSSAGPGVLPTFAGAEPFYRWFSEEASTTNDGLEKISATIRAAVDNWGSTRTNPDSKIVGIIAFSEGAVAACLLLWRQQMGQLPWLPTLHFATLICAAFPDEFAAYLRDDARKHGSESALIDVPTLHIHGLQDWGLAPARKLVADHYKSEFADIMEFEGGRHCLNKREDYEEAARRINRLAQISVPQGG